MSSSISLCCPVSLPPHLLCPSTACCADLLWERKSRMGRGRDEADQFWRIPSHSTSIHPFRHAISPPTNIPYRVSRPVLASVFPVELQEDERRQCNTHTHTRTAKSFPLSCSFTNILPLILLPLQFYFVNCLPFFPLICFLIFLLHSNSCSAMQCMFVCAHYRP